MRASAAGLQPGSKVGRSAPGPSLRSGAARAGSCSVQQAKGGKVSARGAASLPLPALCNGQPREPTLSTPHQPGGRGRGGPQASDSSSPTPFSRVLQGAALWTRALRVGGGRGRSDSIGRTPVRRGRSPAAARLGSRKGRGDVAPAGRWQWPPPGWRRWGAAWPTRRLPARGLSGRARGNSGLGPDFQGLASLGTHTAPPARRERLFISRQARGWRGSLGLGVSDPVDRKPGARQELGRPGIDVRAARGPRAWG